MVEMKNQKVIKAKLDSIYWGCGFIRKMHDVLPQSSIFKNCRFRTEIETLNIHIEKTPGNQDRIDR